MNALSTQVVRQIAGGKNGDPVWRADFIDVTVDNAFPQGVEVATMLARRAKHREQGGIEVFAARPAGRVQLDSRNRLEDMPPGAESATG